MSMIQLQSEMVKFLASGKTDQDSIIKRIDNFYRDYGALNIQKWRNVSNKKNTLLHEFVEKEMSNVIRHLVLERKFDVNMRRDSDGLTPLQLAVQNNSSDICVVLKELDADDIQSEDVGTWLSEDDKGKAMNIVWIDLEMTSIENPEILECAVIITDKDLVELEKNNWVIHFEKSVLESLGDWHQKTFANVDDEGNGLFADVLKSKLTREQVEDELLALIKRHCPPKVCSLAGSSIHIDKQVLQKCMPKVHDYLHYRIIDVTSFQLIMKRWIPEMELKIKNQVAKNGQDTVNHRAMDDIKWSISFMKQLRHMLNKLKDDNQHHRGEFNQNPRGAPNPHPRGRSSPHNRGGPSPHNRGGPSPYPRGGSSPHHPDVSNHEFKRSIIDEQAVEENDDLPKLSPNITQLELYADERRLTERIEIERRFDVKFLHLKDRWQRIYDENPHLREVFMNKRQLEMYDKEFTKENRVLLALMQQSGNSNNGNLSPKKYSTTEHWGQRKLLLTELEFLTKYGSDDRYTVVYAGAAPGSHINFLSSLFPQLEFVLIDDKEFSVKPTDKIRIRNEKFTKDLAKRYLNYERKVLFICNVHTFRAQADPQNDGQEDMENQSDWFKLMNPQVALLNFRLPRQSGKTSYLKGRQIIEPWTSKKPTECRLIVKKGASTVDYNHQDFDDDLLYFQNITRVMYYKHNMDDVDNEGLDHCYDCRAEIYIIQEYLSKVQKLKNDNNLKTSIAAMSRQISEQIYDKSRPRFMNIQRTLAVIPKKQSVVSTNV